MSINGNLKEVEYNSKILEQLLQQPEAAKWENGTYKPYTLTELSEDSEEYRDTAFWFNISSRGLIIKKIERVENPYLLGQYLLKKEKMRRENYAVSETKLFHGTRKNYIDGICRNNFDWRRCGTSRGHKFGCGVSFAKEASYARHYTFGDNIMFIVNVLVGYSTVGNCLTKIPPSPFDTTRNSKCTVYVKYEDDDFYPLYVIYYY